MKLLNRLIVLIVLMGLSILTTGCAKKNVPIGTSDTSQNNSVTTERTEETQGIISGNAVTEVPLNTNNLKSPIKSETSTQKPSPAGSKFTTDEQNSQQANSNILKGKIICIDPGHQKKQDLGLELIAPDSTIKKEKMASGTFGVFTKVPESQLNLTVSLKLQKAFQNLGATVVMTRTSEDVTISNIERAKIANSSGAEVFLRIHADGSASSSTHGISVLYPSKSNLKDTKIVAQSIQLSQCVTNSLAQIINTKNIKQVERDDLTGFNWSRIPVILLEMGFMTNPDEDKLMATDAYQLKIVEGLINGVINYFNLG